MENFWSEVTCIGIATLLTKMMNCGEFSTSMWDSGIHTISLNQLHIQALAGRIEQVQQERQEQ